MQRRWLELQKKDIAVIMKEFAVSLATAKKYIGMTSEEVEALDNITVRKKRKTVFDDYLNIIYKMLRDKIRPRIIISYIIKIGYDGNITTLETKIKRMAENNFNVKLGIDWAYKFVYPTEISALQRREILRHITTKNPKTKISEDIERNIDIIKRKYATIGILESIYNDFYETIMGKDPNKLEIFINKYESSVIKCFIDGIKDDIVSVRNAISSEVSSGFVEGNNNKFKLIKRILYGRANLDTLFKKCYLAFKFGLEDFNISYFTKITQATASK